MKPRALDLFCCAGGASMGLHRAGYDVTGVDIKPQPRYCGDAFIQADVLTLDPAFIAGFDAVHASPTCQKFSLGPYIHPKGRTSGYKVARPRAAHDEHEDLIPETRALVQASGPPYVIENVPRAPLIRPVMLCGTMFGLKVYRHRLFETNWPLSRLLPSHGAHGRTTNAKSGYSTHAHGAEMICCAGNNFRRVDGMAAMEIDWPATRPEVAQMIPPAYTQWLGEQLMAHLTLERAA